MLYTTLRGGSRREGATSIPVHSCARGVWRRVLAVGADKQCSHS